MSSGLVPSNGTRPVATSYTTIPKLVCAASERGDHGRRRCGEQRHCRSTRKWTVHLTGACSASELKRTCRRLRPP